VILKTDSQETGKHSKYFYGPEDISSTIYENIGDPGHFPFTRGIRSHQKGGWIQRELSGVGEPKDSNRQLKYLISIGQTGIDVIGDSATMGYLDPDHPMAVNSVGTQGVSLCRLQDYHELFSELPLDKISVSGSVPPVIALAGLYLSAQKYGFPVNKLRGSVLQPPLYAEDCGYATHLPTNLQVRLSLDSMEFASKEMPMFHSFVEDTYFFSEVGLNPVEEMALGFVEIRYLVRKMLERGVNIDNFAPRIAILVNCGMNVFQEVAKIRATRRLYARMMKEEFGAKDPRSQAVVITSHTSGLSLTAQQSFCNIIRGTIQAMTLVMAGVQAMEISAFDEAYRTPSEASHLIGLRTQQIVHLESHVGQVTDPVGGSYYVESLTNELETRINEMVRDIEAHGDPGELSARGYFRHIFQNSMDRYAHAVTRGELAKVGLNVHQIPEEKDIILRDLVEEKIEPFRARIETIKDYKKHRDMNLVKIQFQTVIDSSRIPTVNLVPIVIKALEAGLTMGEIAGALRIGYRKPYDPFNMVNPPVEYDA
jgi:methylmalonyl-CoA mutase N-terminal domain/subunit